LCVKRVSALLVMLCGMAFAVPAMPHEVRPAYLEIRQTGSASYAITWKQPTMGNMAIHLVPHLSNGWLEDPPTDQYVAAGSLIRTWIVEDKLESLSGQTISVEGLEGTITDVFVRVRLANEPGFDAIVRPDAPTLKISLTNDTRLSLVGFLSLGFEHILSGPDHLVFVLGLLLIMRDRWMLLKTVSAFTLAHSLTLAATTLGLITASTDLLNALIALSIPFLALEVLRVQAGGTSLTIRHPWVVAFLFGLVHGMGFASGLTSLALEQNLLMLALLFFNIGVELGQLAFITLVLALYGLFTLKPGPWPQTVVRVPPYVIGVLGAMWTIENGLLLFGQP
jgi:hypothetical protein